VRWTKQVATQAPASRSLSSFYVNGRLQGGSCLGWDSWRRKEMQRKKAGVGGEVIPCRCVRVLFLSLARTFQGALRQPPALSFSFSLGRASLSFHYHILYRAPLFQPHVRSIPCTPTPTSVSVPLQHVSWWYHPLRHWLRPRHPRPRPCLRVRTVCFLTPRLHLGRRRSSSSFFALHPAIYFIIPAAFYAIDRASCFLHFLSSSVRQSLFAVCSLVFPAFA
jgi:hypothetical protein